MESISCFFFLVGGGVGGVGGAKIKYVETSSLNKMNQFLVATISVPKSKHEKVTAQDL